MTHSVLMLPAVMHAGTQLFGTDDIWTDGVIWEGGYQQLHSIRKMPQVAGVQHSLHRGSTVNSLEGLWHKHIVTSTCVCSVVSGTHNRQCCSNVHTNDRRSMIERCMTACSMVRADPLPYPWGRFA